MKPKVVLFVIYYTFEAVINNPNYNQVNNIAYLIRVILQTDKVTHWLKNQETLQDNFRIIIEQIHLKTTKSEESYKNHLQQSA